MADIFSKYGPTSTKLVKKLADQEDAVANFGKRSDTLKLKDGLTKVRFGPKHPGEESFMHMKASHWFDIDKDGEPVRRRVPNARIHAGIPVDPIEAYVEFAKIKFAGGDADATLKLKKVTAGSFDGGMVLSVVWTSYVKVVKGKVMGPWELLDYKKTVRDALKDAMIIEDEEEAIESDPFTDPKTGKAVLITYNSKANKPTEYYKVQVSERISPLTLEDMQAYDKLTPISKTNDFNYSMQNFDTAMAGLQYFDETEDMGILEDEEFKAILKGIKKELKKAIGHSSAATSISEADEEDADEDIDVDDEDTDVPFDEDTDVEDDDEEVEIVKAKHKKVVAKAAPAKQAKKKIKEVLAVVDNEDEESDDEDLAEPEADADEDQFTEMDRQELLRYKKTKGWDNVKVYKSMDDDAIREALREKEAEADDEESDDEEPTPVKKAVAPPTTKGKITLDAIKAKMAKKKQ